MFGLLKNKISSFISNLTKKTEEKEEKIEQKQPEQPLEQPQKQPKIEKPEEKKEPAREKAKKQTIEEKTEEAKPRAEEKQIEPPLEQTLEHKQRPDRKTLEKEREEIKENKLLEQKPPQQIEERKEQRLGVRLSLESKIRSVFSSEVEIKEKDVRELLENLELSLLEADVAFEVSKELVNDLKSRLVGRRIAKGKLSDEIKNAVKDSLVSVMSVEKPDFWRIMRERAKPVKILFIGPNGAGKTTTMSKIASILMSNNYSCLFSASDTFRAAAIEQTIHHAEKLGISVIKHKYGSDPAAVAFDAVNNAKANGIDVVLIDSAGRQDTNVNLIDELKKINRVIKPDLKLFVGESIAGNAIIEQVNTFHKAIGLDAVILTKLDCDAKGGTALSIAKATSVPILFIGTGQNYGDLIEFNARSLAEQILT